MLQFVGQPWSLGISGRAGASHRAGQNPWKPAGILWYAQVSVGKEVVLAEFSHSCSAGADFLQEQLLGA